MGSIHVDNNQVVDFIITTYLIDTNAGFGNIVFVLNSGNRFKLASTKKCIVKPDD